MKSDLSSSNFLNADLRFAFLNGGIMINTNFHLANLYKTRFSGSDLSKSIFYEAILTESDLSYCNLNSADFRGSDLRGANLSYSDLSNSTFIGSNMENAKLIGIKINDETNFFGANLRNAIIIVRGDSFNFKCGISTDFYNSIIGHPKFIDYVSSLKNPPKAIPMKINNKRELKDRLIARGETFQYIERIIEYSDLPP